MEKFLKGEILTADKLNQLVAELNDLSADSPITGSSTVSAQSDYTLPRFVKPDFCDMHSSDGVPVILDQLKGVNCQGLYARPIEANRLHDGPATRQQNKNLVKLSGEVKGSQSVYQRILTDPKGNVTASDVVLFDICSDSNPTPKLPDYVNNTRGELYKRLARITPNCRIEGVSDPSQAYKVIYTPETNLPPFISNTKGDGVGLLQPLDGNTLPIKRLQAGNNISIQDCGGSVIISGTGGTSSGDCTCSTYYVGCEPILICCNTIRLDYNPCHFFTNCGRLTLTCSITSKLDKGATCYSFQSPLYLTSANSVQLCYDDSDFTTCNNKLRLKNTPLKGVVSSTGDKFSFYDLESKSVPMFYFYVECSEIGIGASVQDGYLRLFGMNS